MDTFEIWFLVCFLLLSIYTIYDVRKSFRKQPAEEIEVIREDVNIILQSDNTIVEPEEDMPYTQKEWTENERLRCIIANRK